MSIVFFPSPMKIKSDRTSQDSPPIGSYCLAESSINKTSPCNNPTSAAGSTSAREPASNNLGLQTRYFNNTGATTDEIAPGDTPGSYNQTREIPDKYAAMISQLQGECLLVVASVKLVNTCKRKNIRIDYQWISKYELYCEKRINRYNKRLQGAYEIHVFLSNMRKMKKLE